MATLRERLAQGDHGAFAELYDACADRVNHYLLMLLGTREDADDALQETFLRLARIRHRLAKVDNLEGYVFTVARNEGLRLAANKARRQRGERTMAIEDLFCHQANDSATPEAAESVAAALARLNPQLREVVELKIYAELTFQQISQVTGLPTGTVATRYRSALAKMQAWLAREA